MIYFVSGHIDVSNDEFLLHYKKELDSALEDTNCSFVIGDAGGVDTFAQQYLDGRIDKTKVTVYHMGPKPRNNPVGYKTIGGFSDHFSKDAAMTEISDVDILWIRPEEETKKLYGVKYRAGRVSGTEKNKIRRSIKESVDKKVY